MLIRVSLLINSIHTNKMKYETQLWFNSFSDSHFASPPMKFITLFMSFGFPRLLGNYFLDLLQRHPSGIYKRKATLQQKKMQIMS